VAQDPGEIRAAIDQTRQEIGDTIEALGRKADLKGRATDKARASLAAARDAASTTIPNAIAPLVDDVSSRARRAARDAQNKPQVALIAGGLLILLFLFGHKRRS
jgi:hypothetical protein